MLRLINYPDGNRIERMLDSELRDKYDQDNLVPG